MKEVAFVGSLSRSYLENMTSAKAMLKDRYVAANYTKYLNKSIKGSRSFGITNIDYLLKVP